MPQGGGGRLSGFRSVKWYRFEKLLARVREETSGRPIRRSMFKALLLQSLYGLSDKELEEALLDRLSFKRLSGWRWMRRCRIIRRCAATATF